MIQMYKTPVCLPAFLVVVGLSLVGCAGSNDGGLLGGSGSSALSSGTWDYMINNAYDATFTDCTGDATALEGLSFVEGLAAAPICLVSGSFDVDQEGSVVTVVSHAVPCSDGSTGSAGGIGAMIGSSLDGQWETTSDTGVSAVQSFSSSVSGHTVEILETARSFSGSFQGSCNLSPPLSSTATIR